MGSSKKRFLNPLEVRKISKATGKSVPIVIIKARDACKCGMDLDYYVKHEMYHLRTAQIREYMNNSHRRNFVEFVAESNNASAYAAYTQLRHARFDFDIPYAYFTKKNLFGASDEVLAKHRARFMHKRQVNARKISEATGMSLEDATALVNRLRQKFGFSAREVYAYMLYTKTEDEIAEFKRSMEEKRSSQVDKIMAETGWDEDEVSAHMLHCWNDFGIDRHLYYIYRCHLLTDEQLALYGTSSDTKKLSARYNGKSAKLLYDKKLFDETYSEFLGRKFWVNRDTDIDEFREFVDGVDAIFCKPLETSTGRGTSRIDLEGADIEEVYGQLMEDSAMIVEECVHQHPEMAAFNPSSVNTVRLVCILKDGEFDAFDSYVRFGMGDVMDNYSSGGVECGVDPATGIINTPAIRKTGEVFDQHPITHLPFEGFQIPHWDKLLGVAEAALRSQEGVNYVGWDLAIRDDDVVIIEGNSTPGLGAYQRFLVERGEGIKAACNKYLA